MNIFGSVESFHLVSNGTQGLKGVFTSEVKREKKRRENTCA